MWVFWLLVIVAQAFAINILVNKGARRKETPMDILQKRYARGEIDEEEYARRRDSLKK